MTWKKSSVAKSVLPPPPRALGPPPPLVVAPPPLLHAMLAPPKLAPCWNDDENAHFSRHPRAFSAIFFASPYKIKCV